MAKLNPGAPAYFLNEESFNYADLNKLSNQFARRLLGHGCELEDRIVLLIPPGFELMAWVLATLKAGCVCVPLDIMDAEQRIQHYLRDSDPKLVIVGDQFRSYCSKHYSIWSSSESFDFAKNYSGDNLCKIPSLETASFIFFTSGTTGRPKGVVQQHSDLNASFKWFPNYFDLSSEDIGIVKSACNMIGFRGESLSMLAVGAASIILPLETRSDLNLLLDAIQINQISFIRLTPSMLRVMLRSGKLGNCKSLRNIVCAGEPLSERIEKQVLATLPETNLYLGYGTTESPGGIYRHCNREKRGKVYTLGRTIGYSQAFILSNTGDLVERGNPGEICLGGGNVARGYWRQPKLTEEKFINNPHSINTGGKLYRTGDEGLQLEDGQFLFLGRLDLQENLNGVRVDLREVEATVVAAFDSVDTAIAIIKRQQEHHDLLVVYYNVVTNTDPPTEQEIKAFLNDKLPSNILPNRVIEIQKFPLNLSGKIDRRALQSYPIKSLKTKHAHYSSDLELNLALIWKNILRLESLPARDEYFHNLGGSSLDIMELAQQLEVEFKQRFSQKFLFDHNTIAKLAHGMTGQSAEMPDNQGIRNDVNLRASGGIPLEKNVDFSQFKPVLLNPNASKGSLICCGAHQEIARAFPEHAVVGLCVPFGSLSAKKFETLAHHYATAIKNMQLPNTICVLGYSLGCEIAFRLAELMQSRCYQKSTLILIDHPVPKPCASDLHLLIAEQGPYVELIEPLKTTIANNASFRGASIRIQECKGNHRSIIQAEKEPGVFEYIGRLLDTQPENMHVKGVKRHPGSSIGLDRKETYESLFTLGSQAMDVCDFDKAKQYFLQAIEIHPAFDAFNQLAWIHESTHDYNTALMYWKKATMARPQSAYALVNLGWLQFHLKKHVATLDSCRVARSRDPYFLDIYEIEYKCLQRLKLYDRVEELQQFVRKNIREMVFNGNRIPISIYFPEGFIQEELDLKKTFNLTENYSIHLFHRACRFKRFQEEEKAIRIFEKVLDSTSLKGLLAKSCFHLGEIYESRNEHKKASCFLHNCLQHNPRFLISGERLRNLPQP